MDEIVKKRSSVRYLVGPQDAGDTEPDADLEKEANDQRVREMFADP